MKENITKDWALYEAGKTYNQQIINQNEISYYDMIDLVYSFYTGNQWKGQETKKLPKPVFNYIKRALTYFVASLTSTNTSINFETISPDVDVAVVNKEVGRVLEKNKIENRIRDMLFAAGITGDSCLHVIFNPNKKTELATGDIEFEIVDGSNVMFGNANITNVEKQPYIILVGRDLARNLEAELKVKKEPISEDSDYLYMPRR